MSVPLILNYNWRRVSIQTRSRFLLTVDLVAAWTTVTKPWRRSFLFHVACVLRSQYSLYTIQLHPRWTYVTRITNRYTNYQYYQNTLSSSVFWNSAHDFQFIVFQLFQAKSIFFITNYLSSIDKHNNDIAYSSSVGMYAETSQYKCHLYINIYLEYD